MSDRAKRDKWVAEGKCFVCGKPVEAQSNIDKRLCVFHYIRLALRKREIFYIKPIYRSHTSRVKRERFLRRQFIVNYLRARYIALRDGHVKPFANFREALFFIDDMWSELSLYHSFPLRTARVGDLIAFLMHLDYLATKGWKKGWVGSPANRRHSPERAALKAAEKERHENDKRRLGGHKALPSE